MPLLTLNGKVLAADHKPLGSATIEAFSLTQDQPQLDATTRVFRTRSSPRGDYVLKVSAELLAPPRLLLVRASRSGDLLSTVAIGPWGGIVEAGLLGTRAPAKASQWALTGEAARLASAPLGAVAVSDAMLTHLNSVEVGPWPVLRAVAEVGPWGVLRASGVGGAQDALKELCLDLYIP